MRAKEQANDRDRDRGGLLLAFRFQEVFNHFLLVEKEFHNGNYECELMVSLCSEDDERLY